MEGKRHHLLIRNFIRQDLPKLCVTVFPLLKPEHPGRKITLKYFSVAGNLSLSLASSILKKRLADILEAGQVIHSLPTATKGETPIEIDGAGSAITQLPGSCDLQWNYFSFCYRNLWICFFSSVNLNTSAGDRIIES